MAFDTQVFYLFNNLAGQSHVLDSTIVFFGNYFAYITVAAFIALVFFSQYSKLKKWEILVIAGTASIISRFGGVELIRAFIHRPRPFTVLPIHQLLTDSAWSFPSGHASFFFAMSTVIYLYNKKWGIGFFIASVLIGVARVAAGVHYPSDILGGAVLGVGVGYVTFHLFRKYSPEGFSKS